jgi:SAM-dependent methyltransferase
VTRLRDDRPDWAPSELEAVPSCPVCEGSGSSLHAGLTDRVYRIAGGTWNLDRCTACRSAYLNPRPTPAAIDRAYAGYCQYDRAGHVATLAALTGSGLRLGRVRAALANDSLRARFGCRIEPAWPSGRLVARALRSRRRDVEMAARHLELPHPGARLLDVGTGSGWFVAYAQMLGWDAEGLEPDAGAVAVGREAGLPVREGVIADAPYDDASFEALTMNHVIEHLHDPVADLARCLRLLRPGGRVWVATPNLDSVGHAVFGRDWLHLDPPRHLVLFNADSLRKALASAGFDGVTLLDPPLSARFTFTASAAIQAGADPMRPFSAPSGVLTRARQANRATMGDARRGEELVVVATRPADR